MVRVENQKQGFHTLSMGVKIGVIARGSNFTILNKVNVCIMSTQQIYMCMTKCKREEQNLTPCWICFFYFNLCSPLLFVNIISKRMLYIAIGLHNGLPRGTLPLCLNVKVPLFSSQRNILTLPTCEWLQERRNEHIRFQRLVKPGDIWKDLWPIYFTSSPPPPLCSIKETSIQTPIRWYSGTLVCHLLGCPAF